MNRKIDRLLLTTVLLLAVVSLQCATRATVVSSRPELPAPDITVAQDGSADYETISDALDDAEADDVILIKPGIYKEDIEIDEDAGPFTLVGEDPATTVIDADGAYAALTLKSDGNHISGLTLRGGESHGLYITGGRQKVDYCLITGNGDRGIYISTMSDTGSAADIDHCTIAGNEISAIYCANKDEKTTITNSIFADNKRSLIYDGDGLNLVVKYTCLHSTDTDSDEPKSGSNNFRKDAKFKDSKNGNYKLKPGSPCLKAAADGSNQGCF